MKRNPWPKVYFFAYFLLLLTDSSSPLSFCTTREKSSHDKSQFTDIWSSFLIGSVLHLFLESEHLMVIGEKRHLSLAHWEQPRRSWTYWSGFPYVLETCHPLLTGGFCCIMSGFLYSLLASTCLFIELIHIYSLSFSQQSPPAPDKWRRAPYWVRF